MPNRRRPNQRQDGQLPWRLHSQCAEFTGVDCSAVRKQELNKMESAAPESDVGQAAAPRCLACWNNGLERSKYWLCCASVYLWASPRSLVAIRLWFQPIPLDSKATSVCAEYRRVSVWAAPAEAALRRRSYVILCNADILVTLMLKVQQCPFFTVKTSTSFKWMCGTWCIVLQTFKCKQPA